MDDVFSALALKKLGLENPAHQMLKRCAENASGRTDSVAMDYVVAGLAERYLGDSARAQENFHHALALDPLLWEARSAMAEKNVPQ
jgi:tetratricopeptide (TPR) repeat protein